MICRAVIQFDRADGELGTIRVERARAVEDVEPALRQADSAGGMYWRVMLMHRATRQIIYSARTKQRGSFPAFPQVRQETPNAHSQSR